MRGFLPERDPASSFPCGSELTALDEIGRHLPSMLEEADFRAYARTLRLPPWSEDRLRPETLAHLRLYYVRTGFLASAYINHVGQPRATDLPKNLALPLCKAAALLGRPPILSYDGYALYNWKRFDPNGPIALGNIDTVQNFVHLYDEHWFILVHVEIEAIADEMFAAIERTARAMKTNDAETVNRELQTIAGAIQRQAAVLRRIPEKMDPALYHRTFRPYIRFFENVVYEGVSHAPMSFRGETGAQSSIMPSLIAFMKIPHQQSALTDHLVDMRRFMPAEHRQVINDIEAMPSVRDIADPRPFNDVLEAMADFREVHYKWAQEYIHRWVDDPRGTGGTPYMTWLKQLIDETRAHKRS
jgi:indoleamine 2,3-dioxygenase